MLTGWGSVWLFLIFQLFKSNIAEWSLKQTERHNAEDSKWGPNKVFEFPAQGGTGAIWNSVADLIPANWFRFGHTVSCINLEKNVLQVKTNLGPSYFLKYDHLITTVPLDSLLTMVRDSDPKLTQLRAISQEFVYSHTHVIGIGLKGQPPNSLSTKSWIYFPDSDSPVYRVTVFSNYADDNVPYPGETWSLMCEAAEPKAARNKMEWSENFLISQTINALELYGFINRDQVVSTYHRRLEHGYPVPFLNRENYLGDIQPWLESRSIFSRGRFGGWKYEVSNQDHSFMQGVEVADFLAFGTPEETYPNASLVNSMKASDRMICSESDDFEIVVAHYNEDLSWVAPYAHNTHVYDKGGRQPDMTFKQWTTLPNVGRESHTYLHHIITNYHCLANVTLFTQGGVTDHVNWGGNADLKKYLTEAKNNGFFWDNEVNFGWGRIQHLGKWKEMLNKGELLPAKLKTLGEFWKALTHSPHTKKLVKFSAGSFFSVSRARILLRPKEFYEKAITFVDHHSNPEEGHYFERIWKYIFST